jgi:hypothetical protein
MRNFIKGNVQRILRGVETRLIQSVLLEGRPFLIFNFKGTPSQEEP